MLEHNPSRHTILLIKPNRSLARITGRVLQDHRFVVTQVPAAAEALEVLGTQYPDAVVLDSDLTNGASGMVLDRLRQLGQRGRPSPSGSLYRRWIVEM